MRGERGREGGREGEREGEREGGRERGREGGREGGRDSTCTYSSTHVQSCNHITHAVGREGKVTHMTEL